MTSITTRARIIMGSALVLYIGIASVVILFTILVAASPLTIAIPADATFMLEAGDRLVFATGKGFQRTRKLGPGWLRYKQAGALAPAISKTDWAYIRVTDREHVTIKPLTGNFGY